LPGAIENVKTLHFAVEDGEHVGEEFAKLHRIGGAGDQFIVHHLHLFSSADGVEDLVIIGEVLVESVLWFI